MAMGLTMLVPGLGQLAAGRARRGLIWFAIWLALFCVTLTAAIWPVMVPVVFVSIPLAFLVLITGWVDAFRIGALSKRPMLNQPQTRYLLGIMAAAFGLIGLPNIPAALCIRYFLCEAFVIPTASMAPTVAAHNRVLVHKLAPPHRWSVIAFHAPIDPRTIYLKRIVGLPGETVEVSGGELLINGKSTPLPHEMGATIQTQIAQRNAGHEHPLTLKSDEYFVIGDNTAGSFDSRYWPTGINGHQPGAVPADMIVGVGTYVYWPVSRWKKLY